MSHGSFVESKRSHRWLLALLCALALFALVACSGDPVERTIERLDGLVVLLETHKGQPDVMLDELEAWVAEHEDQWAADRAAVDALDEEAQKRLEARHEYALQRSLGQLYDVSQEILVTLEDEPHKRTRFIELLGRIK